MIQYHVAAHSDFNGLQYFTVVQSDEPDTPKIYRMKGFTAVRSVGYPARYHAECIAEKRARAKGVPYLPGRGKHLERIMYEPEYFTTADEAAQRYGFTVGAVRDMANGRLSQLRARDGVGWVAIRWMYSKKRNVQPRKMGRPLGSKNKKPAKPRKPVRVATPAPVPARPPGRPSTATRTLGRPDTTGWPSISWDVLPHPGGYVAWRAAVRGCGGYALRHTAWFPSHAAAGRFALSVVGG